MTEPFAPKHLALRPALPADAEFLYQLLKASLQEYVDQTWGWNEQWQRDHFQQKFDPSRSQIILLEREAIGVIAVDEREKEIFLSNIQILPAYQGRGVGSYLIQSLLEKARAEGKDVTLQVLKVNPARALYQRLGFVIVGQSETHYQMRQQTLGRPNAGTF
jgi:ribosomal protein S18 acetylase RimI-like enzyme